MQVGGPNPYTRCLAHELSERDWWRQGSLRLRIQDRTLSVAGVQVGDRIAMGAGPSPGTFDDALLHALDARDAKLLLVVGELATSPAESRILFSRLADLKMPVVAIAGGRDQAGAFRSGTEATDGAVVDGRGLRSIDFGDFELFLLSGGPRRYVSGPGGCGYEASDLEPLAFDQSGADRSEQDGKEKTSVWVAWSHAGLDTGLLRRLSQAGIAQGFYAWPYHQGDLPRYGLGTLGVEAFSATSTGEEFEWIGLPRVGGPPRRLLDGTLKPSGLVWLLATSQGLRAERVATEDASAP